MAHPTLEYIRGLRKTLETKKAEIVGESPSSIPGAEHDSKPDAAAKEPDPETKDQTMVPNSGLTVDGAGDDSKITHTTDLIAGEPALTPAKQPEVTGDADAKTAEKLAAELTEGINAWYAAKKQAEAATDGGKKEAADTAGPSAGEGTAEALITDTGKEPEQTKDVVVPEGKDEVTTDAMAPATGEGSVGETAAAAKEAGALDMELTSDVLAKIAAVMLATEEGTALAESVLAKAAGAEAAEKTIGFLREQNELAQKQAEYQAGQRDAIELIMKSAQELEAQELAGGDDTAAAEGDDGGIAEIADTLDAMVESGEITEDEADQVVEEIALALAGDDTGADGGDTAEGAVADVADAEKAAQAVDPAAAGAPAAGDAAIDQTVAVDPAQFDPASIPSDGVGDVTPDDIADAVDSLVESGEITEDEADQLVQEIAGGAGAEEDVSPEEVATALQDAVASGELSPEDVQQVLTELEGVPAPDDAAAADAAAADATAAAGEAQAANADATAAADAAAAAAPAEEKTAAAKLLAAIKAARAAGSPAK